MISYENEVPGRNLSKYGRPHGSIIYSILEKPSRIYFLHLISSAIYLKFFRETFTHIIVDKFSNHSSRRKSHNFLSAAPWIPPGSIPE